MSFSPQRPADWTWHSAPDDVLERHLRLHHGKKAGWVNEKRDDLRSAHYAEHLQSTQSEHGLDEALR